MKNVPNLFTLLNLVFGCVAIIFILQTGQTIAYVEREGFTSWNLPEKIAWGSLFIFAAAIVDFLDGFVARLFKSTSAMGKQLDSLADVVSFGVAPGLIMYQLLRISFAKEEDGLDVSISWLLPSLLIPCAAAWRLAKFNLDESQAFSFKGLPTPAGGIVIASLPIIIFYQQFGLETTLTNKWFLYLIIIVISYLMISNLRFISMKFKNFNAKENFPKYLLIIFSIVALIFLKAVAVPVILVFYILVSLIFPKGHSDKKNIA
jgi:CDP-diacylglycerol--serine O-phosphatidyltransferase